MFFCISCLSSHVNGNNIYCHIEEHRYLIWVNGGNLTKVILNPVDKLTVLNAFENVFMVTG